jgi:leucyl-tRNA synthetase
LPTDSYVHVTGLALGEQLDFSHVRGYVIADAHARYRRAQGDDVLFALPVDGPTDRLSELRGQLDSLALSFDWERSAASGDPEIARWSQWLFAKLVERDLAYQRGDSWFLRMAAFIEENDRRTDELEGWSDAARAAQRELLHRVDGFDFDATALDGTTVSVFTGHPDSVADAEFVGLSPRHAELDRWLEDGDVRAKVEGLRSGDFSNTPLEQMPVVEVGMSVQVPSVAQPLPILVSPAIDARFGAAAILGIPNVDPIDKALARHLPKMGGLAWKVESKPPKTTPAHRYLVDDMPLSDGPGGGAAVPVIHCDACGAVPVPEDRLPIEAGQDPAADCPRCGQTARRDPGTIHSRLVDAWLELALAVPADGRAAGLFESPELSRWLPTAQSVVPVDSAVALLDMRTVAKAIRDLAGDAATDGEPLGPTAAHGGFDLEGLSLEEAVGRYGSDAIRFAILNSASPAKPFAGGASSLDQAAALLGRVRELAERHIDGAGSATGRIDLGDGLRRRLAGWCDTAVERIGANLQELELHRATRNLAELVNRLEDFDRRVTEHRGEVSGQDAEALGAGLLVLTRVLGPVAPQLAADLWLRAGCDGDLDGAAWPERQRAAATA